jgi:hypothetical protein
VHGATSLERRPPLLELPLLVLTKLPPVPLDVPVPMSPPLLPVPWARGVPPASKGAGVFAPASVEASPLPARIAPPQASARSRKAPRNAGPRLRDVSSPNMAQNWYREATGSRPEFSAGAHGRGEELWNEAHDHVKWPTTFHSFTPSQTSTREGSDATGSARAIVTDADAATSHSWHATGRLGPAGVVSGS